MTENLKSCRVSDIMFGIIEKNIPILEIGNKIGITDYIDFIHSDEVTHHVMRGMDCWRRHFIVIQFFVNGDKSVQTFFQRYTNDENLWVGCRVRQEKIFMDTVGGLKRYQAHLLEDVVNGKGVMIDEDHECFYNGNNCEVRSYNEKEWESAKIIQKHWESCRFDPKYKMCRNIFERGITDIYSRYKIDLI